LLDLADSQKDRLDAQKVLRDLSPKGSSP